MSNEKVIEALERWIDNGHKCPTCQGTKSVLAHRPTIYCTDSDDEIEDAYQIASRPCPDCPGFTAILAALRAQQEPSREEMLLQRIGMAIGLMNHSPQQQTVLRWWNAVLPELAQDIERTVAKNATVDPRPSNLHELGKRYGDFATNKMPRHILLSCGTVRLREDGMWEHQCNRPAIESKEPKP